MFHLGIDWWEDRRPHSVVYVALVVGFRLFGKREIGQMAPFDLVMILLIANAVQNAMVGTDTSVIGGLIAAAPPRRATTASSSHGAQVPGFRKLVEGESAVLIYRWPSG